MKQLVIKNARVIDPANNREGEFEIRIVDGKIVEVDKKLKAQKEDEVFDAKGWVQFAALLHK